MNAVANVMLNVAKKAADPRVLGVLGFVFGQVANGLTGTAQQKVMKDTISKEVAEQLAQALAEMQKNQ